MITEKNKKYAIKAILGFGKERGEIGFKGACICLLALGVDPELVYEAVDEPLALYNQEKQFKEMIEGLENEAVFEKILRRMNASKRMKN